RCLPVGLLDELSQMEPTCVAAARSTPKQVAVAGLGLVGHDAERHEISRLRRLDSGPHGRDEGGGISNDVVGRENQQQRVVLGSRGIALAWPRGAGLRA